MSKLDTVARPETERPAARPLRVGLISTALAALLTASALVAIGAGPASIAPADTAGYLWAALIGGTIPADEVSRYQIVWQIRTPRVLLAAVVGAGLGAMGAARNVRRPGPSGSKY